MPSDIATCATDMPGSSHCANTIDLNCDPYRRRVFPLSLVIVSTYSYVDTILPGRAGQFKVSWPDGYQARDSFSPGGFKCPLGRIRNPALRHLVGPLQSRLMPDEGQHIISELASHFALPEVDGVAIGKCWLLQLCEYLTLSRLETPGGRLFR
jgi:hypothetical protein